MTDRLQVRATVAVLLVSSEATEHNVLVSVTQAQAHTHLELGYHVWPLMEEVDMGHCLQFWSDSLVKHQLWAEFLREKKKKRLEVTNMVSLLSFSSSSSPMPCSLIFLSFLFLILIFAATISQKQSEEEQKRRMCGNVCMCLCVCVCA